MNLTLDRSNMTHQVVWTIVRPDNTIETMAYYKSREQARAFLKSGAWPKGSRVARMLILYTVKEKA